MPEHTLTAALEAARSELIDMARAEHDSHVLAAQAYAVTAIAAMIPKPTGLSAAEIEHQEHQAAITTAAGRVTDIITAGLLTRDHFHGVYEALLDPLDELIAATLANRHPAA